MLTGIGLFVSAVGLVAYGIVWLTGIGKSIDEQVYEFGQRIESIHVDVKYGLSSLNDRLDRWDQDRFTNTDMQLFIERLGRLNPDMNIPEAE